MVNNGDTHLKDLGSGIDNILGTAFALDLLLDVVHLRAWLHSKHTVLDDSRLFIGYRFAVDTLLRVLYQSIERSAGLMLSEDIIFQRASFVGIPLEKLPESCDKSLMLKNMRRITLPLLKAKTWDEAARLAEEVRNRITQPLLGLQHISRIAPGISVKDINDLVRYCSMFQVYIFLNDTHRGFPHGYLMSLVRSRPTTSQLSHVIPGYVLTVQYLWAELLADKLVPRQ